MKKDSMRTWRGVTQKEAAHFATLCSDLFGDSPARPSPGFIVAIASSSVRSSESRIVRPPRSSVIRNRSLTVTAAWSWSFAPST